MQTYILHWNDCREEIVRGHTFNDAVELAGYNAGGLMNLWYYEEVEEE